jgi:hypothetical protein
MILSFSSKADVVEYVNVVLQSLRPDSQLTMTIQQGKSEVFSASTAIEELSEDFVETWAASNSYLPHRSTSQDRTQDG